LRFTHFWCGGGLPSKSASSPKNDFAGGVYEQGEEIPAEALAAVFPCIAVGRLGHSARDAPSVAVLVGVADEGAL